MVKRNEFAEIISAIFAIIVFSMIGGVLIGSLREQVNIFGNFAGLFSLVMILLFIAIIFKLIIMIKNIFS